MTGAVWAEPEFVELRGECDGCRVVADLWQCDDDPGAWLYCYGCAVALCRRAGRTVG